jgi:hypothetical protein
LKISASASNSPRVGAVKMRTESVGTRRTLSPAAGASLGPVVGNEA